MIVFESIFSVAIMSNIVKRAVVEEGERGGGGLW